VYDADGLEEWIRKKKKNTFISDAVVVFQNFFQDKQPDTQRRFLEVGALDGLSGSNTWPYDSYLGWQGLLIEISSKNFAELIKRRGGAFKAQIALCESSKPVTITGTEGCCSGIDSSMSDEHIQAFFSDERENGGVLLCLPLTLIMEAMD